MNGRPIFLEYVISLLIDKITENSVTIIHPPILECSIDFWRQLRKFSSIDVAQNVSDRANERDRPNPVDTPNIFSTFLLQQLQCRFAIAKNIIGKEQDQRVNFLYASRVGRSAASPSLRRLSSS